MYLRERLRRTVALRSRSAILGHDRPRSVAATEPTAVPCQQDSFARSLIRSLTVHHTRRSVRSLLLDSLPMSGSFRRIRYCSSRLRFCNKIGKIHVRNLFSRIINIYAPIISIIFSFLRFWRYSHISRSCMSEI